MASGCQGPLQSRVKQPRSLPFQVFSILKDAYTDGRSEWFPQTVPVSVPTCELDGLGPSGLPQCHSACSPLAYMHVVVV
jgi:hypothetical protein